LGERRLMGMRVRGWKKLRITSRAGRKLERKSAGVLLRRSSSGQKRRLTKMTSFFGMARTYFTGNGDTI